MPRRGCPDHLEPDDPLSLALSAQELDSLLPIGNRRLGELMSHTPTAGVGIHQARLSAARTGFTTPQGAFLPFWHHKDHGGGNLALIIHFQTTHAPHALQSQDHEIAPGRDSPCCFRRNQPVRDWGYTSGLRHLICLFLGHTHWDSGYSWLHPQDHSWQCSGLYVVLKI